MAGEEIKAGNGREARTSRTGRGVGATAVTLTVVAFAMLGMAFAAVPLYRMFCQATGFNGTTQRAAAGSEHVVDATVVVRFDTTITPGLPWRFEPVERQVTVRLGETRLVHFRAENLAGRTVTGTATFNVTPEAAGAYFNKIQCFCFNEQTLAPGEVADMPVSFFVDPAMLQERGGDRIGLITLSYTFFETETPAPAAASSGDKATATSGG
ncbi:MAG: cytochrome c oxidase assembly protein [Hyphomicrobiaceae bacterium]